MIVEDVLAFTGGAKNTVSNSEKMGLNGELDTRSVEATASK